MNSTTCGRFHTLIATSTGTLLAGIECERRVTRGYALVSRSAYALIVGVSVPLDAGVQRPTGHAAGQAEDTGQARAQGRPGMLEWVNHIR